MVLVPTVECGLDRDWAKYKSAIHLRTIKCKVNFCEGRIEKHFILKLFILFFYNLAIKLPTNVYTPRLEDESGQILNDEYDNYFDSLPKSKTIFANNY